MPSTNWFDAVTDDLYTAWDDQIHIEGLSIDPVDLDIKTGAEVFIVRADGIPFAGIPVSIANSSVAEASGTASGPAGQIQITPKTVGFTTIQLGPYPGFDAAIFPVSVINSALSGTLVIIPSGQYTLDIQTGGYSFGALYNGRPIVGVPVYASNTNVEAVDVLTDNDGRFRVEPLAVGTVAVTLVMSPEEIYYTTDDDNELVEITGLSGTAMLNVTVISSVPPIYISALRLSPSTPLIGIPIGSRAREIVILDNQMQPIPNSLVVEADVSLPGFATISSDARGGRFKLAPVGVGEGKIEFSMTDPSTGRTMYIQRRFTVTP